MAKIVTYRRKDEEVEEDEHSLDTDVESLVDSPLEDD